MDGLQTACLPLDSMITCRSFCPSSLSSISCSLSVFVFSFFLRVSLLSCGPTHFWDALKLLICESLYYLFCNFLMCIFQMCHFAAPHLKSKLYLACSPLSPTSYLSFCPTSFHLIFSGWWTVGKKNRGSTGKEPIYIYIIFPALSTLAPSFSLYINKDKYYCCGPSLPPECQS